MRGRRSWHASRGDAMWAISAVSLVIVMAGCLAGIFAPKHIYNDNLAQRIGMAGVFCFCWPRLAQIIDQQALSAQVVPAAAQLAGHVGMACFVLGTAFKAWRHRPHADGAYVAGVSPRLSAVP